MRRNTLFSTRSFWSDEKDQPTQMHINRNTYQTNGLKRWYVFIFSSSIFRWTCAFERSFVDSHFWFLLNVKSLRRSFFNRERLLFVSTNCDKKNVEFKLHEDFSSNRQHRTIKKTILNLPFCACKFCFDFYVSIHTGAQYSQEITIGEDKIQAKTEEKTHRNNERQKCKIRLYAIPHTSVEAIKPLWRPKQLVEIC